MKHLVFHFPASEWARYRDELEQMLSKGVDARMIIDVQYFLYSL